MADECTDLLFDTSSQAMAARLLRFRATTHQERIAHALQSLLMAVDDVQDAVQLAQTRAELDRIRAVSEDTIAALITASTIALTTREFLDR